MTRSRSGVKIGVTGRDEGSAGRSPSTSSRSVPSSSRAGEAGGKSPTISNEGSGKRAFVAGGPHKDRAATERERKFEARDEMRKVARFSREVYAALRRHISDLHEDDSIVHDISLHIDIHFSRQNMWEQSRLLEGDEIELSKHVMNTKKKLASILSRLDHIRGLPYCGDVGRRYYSFRRSRLENSLRLIDGIASEIDGILPERKRDLRGSNSRLDIRIMNDLLVWFGREGAANPGHWRISVMISDVYHAVGVTRTKNQIWSVIRLPSVPSAPDGSRKARGTSR